MNMSIHERLPGLPGLKAEIMPAEIKEKLSPALTIEFHGFCYYYIKI
jgi:hypothetical protein